MTCVEGLAPGLGQRQARIRGAAQILVAGQASLDQIAHDAGDQDRTGFPSAFRKVYGCDPAELRAAVLKGALFIGL